MPRASSLAAEIKKELGVEPELIKGRNGVFNVTVGNDLVFSKHETGRFPEEKEVIDQLRKRA